VVIGAKGVRGALRIKSFTAVPGDIAAYGPVSTEDGRVLTLKVTEHAKDVVVAQTSTLADRTAAEALKGMRLYIPRAALPQPEAGSYYHADLIGLAVRLATGETRGTVSAVLNYGAGDILEVTRADGDTDLIPFTDAVIAAVDVGAKAVTIRPVPGLFDDDAVQPNGEP
jgi:16S rRNA processing protein RimM